MLITEYGVLLDDKKHPYLAEEKSVECPGDGRMLHPKDAVYLLTQFCNLVDRADEYGYMIATDSSGNVLGVFQLSHGTVNKTFLCPRDIATRLLLLGAVAGIVVHNHPSGNLTVSYDDKLACADIMDICSILQVQLSDFIIVSRKGYYSFLENDEFTSLEA